jgi:hypothetical protein
MMTTSRPSENDQEELFQESKPKPPIDDRDEEPKPNSPEDLGLGQPAGKVFGDPRPEPDPIRVNACSSAIQHDDVRKFVAWIYAQEDLEIHAEVTFGHVIVGLSGFSPTDLGWLCQAIRQAGKAPAPYVMRQALLKKDVGILRAWDPPRDS